MSVIAVRKHEEDIIMCSDYQWSYGDHKIDNDVWEKTFDIAKMCKYDWGLLWAVGSTSESILFYNRVDSNSPSKLKNSKEVFKWYVQYKEDAKKIWEHFKEESTYIIVIHDKIYILWEARLAQEIREYFAIWSGSDIALWVMSIWLGSHAAVSAASNICITCWWDIQTLTYNYK